MKNNGFRYQIKQIDQADHIVFIFWGGARGREIADLEQAGSKSNARIECKDRCRPKTAFPTAKTAASVREGVDLYSGMSQLSRIIRPL